MISPRLLAALSCAACALLGAAPAVAAPGPPHIDVHAQQRGPGGYMPVSWFIVDGRPGAKRVVGRLLVRNGERRPLRVTIDPVRGVTAKNLGSAYEVRGAHARGAALWTHLSARKLTIGPRSTATIAVSLAVPAGATPGDHLSGIAVEARGEDRAIGGRATAAVASALRFVVGLQVALPGARRPHVVVDDVRVERYPSGVTFVARARNDGNAILHHVRGELVARRDGRTVFKQTLGPGAFITHSELQWEALAGRERPAEGTRYDVNVVLHYAGGDARIARVVTFGKRQARIQQDYLAPGAAPTRTRGGLAMWVIGAVGAALLGVVVVVWRVRRRSVLLTRAAGLRVLTRELAAASEARPVSVILVAAGEGAAIDADAVAGRIRARVRRSDALCDLSPEALLVIAADTSARAAEGLADDIARQLAAMDEAAHVGVATATVSTGAEHLLAEARRPERASAPA
jgi:hypothetical protein